MTREVEALIDELFNSVEREDVVDELRLLRSAAKEMLHESEHTTNGDSQEEAELFEKAWRLPAEQRARLIAQLLVGEAVFRRLKKEEAAGNVRRIAKVAR